MLSDNALSLGLEHYTHSFSSNETIHPANQPSTQPFIEDKDAYTLTNLPYLISVKVLKTVFYVHTESSLYLVSNLSRHHLLICTLSGWPM